MVENRGLAVAALVLGIVGLFTAGVLVIGSLVGMVMAGAALARGPSRDQDIAGAALAANVFALFTVLPLGIVLLSYPTTAGPLAQVAFDAPLPEPAAPAVAPGEAGLSAPPPPPVASTRLAADPVSPSAPVDEAQRPAPDPAPAPVRVSGDIEQPRKTRNVNPVYPQAALREGVQGVVILECTISPQGKVVAVKVLQSVPELDQAAIDAVTQWEYTPTLLNGVVVPVIMTVTVNFKLS